MRLLLFVCLLGACDPVWKIENVATASAGTQADGTCIETALKQTGYEVKPSGEVAAPKRGWYAGNIRVTWDPARAQVVDLAVYGVGTQPPYGTLPTFRTRRDMIMTKLNETCGPFELGPESCQRVDCSKAN